MGKKEVLSTLKTLEASLVPQPMLTDHALGRIVRKSLGTPDLFPAPKQEVQGASLILPAKSMENLKLVTFQIAEPTMEEVLRFGT